MWKRGRGIHVFHREVNETWDIVAISFCVFWDHALPPSLSCLDQVPRLLSAYLKAIVATILNF